MSLDKTAILPTIKESIGIGLMLGLMPAFAFGIAKSLLFANYFELGMYQTAFYYFRSTINDNLILLAVVAPTVFIYFVLAALFKDRGARKRYTHYVVTLMMLGLLLVTAYRLNKSPWYPDFFSISGFFCNAMVVLLFGLLWLVIVKQSPTATFYVGLAMGLLVLITNGCFYYDRSRTPVIFTDVAEEVGLREINNSLGVAWGDYNNDGWTDVYVSNHLPASAESFLYENRKGVFAAPRVMATGDLHGVAWGDFDNDGALDLFVAGGNNTPQGPAFPNILFHNEGTTFKDVASSAGVEDTLGRAWGGAWADFNNDGLLDLFVVNRFTSNALFLNAGDGTFKDVARIAGITDTGPGEANKAGTVCASWADYDDDGDMDLLTVAISTGIALYRNNGNGTFSEVAGDLGLVTNSYLGTEDDPRGLSGCAWGDYDNDGDPDLYIGALTGKIGRNLLFQNKGNSTFIEVGAAAGVDTSAHSRAVLWGDYDNDGDLDLYVVNEASDSTDIPRGDDPLGWNNLYLNRGDGTFVNTSADAGGVAGFPFVREGTAAIADYDNDGFIDVFINNQRSLEGHPSYLTRNILLRNSGNRHSWLEIRLRGTVSNRDGIGTKISLFAGKQRQFRERGGESHAFAQNSMVIHFGLGSVKVVDRLLVKWPSGITQTLTNISANRTLTVTEPVTDLPR